MKIRYDIIANPKPLDGELSVIDEKFRVMYYDGYIVIEFLDIQREITNVIEDEEIIDTLISYSKVSRVIVDDEIILTCVPCTFDSELLDSIVLSHDATKVQKTDIENIQSDNAILMREILTIKGVI